MSDIVRLTLLTHGMTEAMAAGRFPADEPLNELGARQVGRNAVSGGVDRVLTGPEARTRQTAQLCGWQSTVDPLLADLDCGRWRGESLGGIEPSALRQWLSDTASAPHGGESIAALLDRVTGWLDTVRDDTGRTVAVTHPAVVRAAILIALGAPAESFWRIDIPPASRTTLHHRDSWTLRMP